MKPRNFHSLQSLFSVGLVLVVVLSMIPLSGCSRPSAKMHRVGILAGLPYADRAVDGFRDRMTELGYIEGQNITYDLQRTSGVDIPAYQPILQRFVADKVDLIFVFPTEASLEAKAATKDTGIPVVFSVAHTEGVGLVDSIREPGGNITGVRFPGPESTLKRMEIMMQIAPHAKRWLVPYLRDYPIVPPQLERLRPAAASAGITLIEAPAQDVQELEAILQAHEFADGSTDIDALLLIAEPLILAPQAFLAAARFAERHRIPMGGAYMEVQNYRSLFGVTIDFYKSGQQAAFLADKILRGTPAGTLPVLTADLYIQINYQVARELGLEVPAQLLGEADEVIR